MVRKTSNRTFSNKPTFTKKSNIPKIPEIKTENKPNIGSTIKEGIGLGIGVGIGSKIANSTIDMFTKKNEQNTDLDVNQIKRIDINQTYCNNLLKDFKECIQLNDANMCKDKLNNYYNCINDY